MTPQFLRSEAARFREMAESVTDREASRQRLLAMALDYDARAAAAEAVRSTEPQPLPEPQTEAEEPLPDAERAPPADETRKPRIGRRRLTL